MGMIYEELFRKREECEADGKSHNREEDHDDRNPGERSEDRDDKHSNHTTQFSVNDLFEKRGLGTWKRSRNHQFSHKKDRRGFKSLKKLDLFNSSPSLSLLDKSSDNADKETIRKTSLQLDNYEVLQYRSYELHGSLITLNFTESQQTVPSQLSDDDNIPSRNILDDLTQNEPEISKNNDGAGKTLVRNTEREEFVIVSDRQSPEISSSDNQKDINDVTEEITDSDSGIYSLYDNVNITKQIEINSENEGQSSQDPDRNFIADAFYESKTLRDLLSDLQQRTLKSFNHELVAELRRRHDTLTQYLNNLELEKVEVNDSLINFQDRIKETEQPFQKKLLSLLKQIDVITNLIFGIEMKIEKCSYNAFNVIDTEMWQQRLEEALHIKTCHCENLKILLKSRMDVENQLWLEEKILSKQRILCHLKLIKSEIYCNEMQLKILLM